MKRINTMFFYTLRAWLMQLVAVVLRDHGKRILFITTVYLQFNSLNVIRKDALEKLNSLMHLARSEEALEYPGSFHAVIWNGETLQQNVLKACGTDDIFCSLIGKAEAARACDAILDLTPKWLTYGSRSEMSSDLLRLIGGGVTS